MRRFRIMVGLVGLVCSAPLLQAQDAPRGSPRPSHSMMATMDSLNRRLDSLVDRMNRAAGGQKVAAMAAVINEMVTQRRLMQKHMHQMMGDSGRRMQRMNDTAMPSRQAPSQRPDSAAFDSTDAHHPGE